MIDANQKLCVVIYLPSPKPFYMHSMCAPLLCSHLWPQNDQMCFAMANSASSKNLCQCLHVCLENSYKYRKSYAFSPVESYYLLAAIWEKQFLFTRF